MITKPFREAMVSAISRLIAPYSLEEKCPWLADMLLQAEFEVASMEALLPVCWVIEYNEADSVSAKSKEDIVALLNVKTSQEFMDSFPALYRTLCSHKKDTETVFSATAFEENPYGKKTFDNIAYQVFIKYFKNSEFDGRSIVRIGLGLRMSIDEINRVLLSYGKQTVTWHRVDDLLFRFAVEKGWTYTHFHSVYTDYLNYRAAVETQAQTTDCVVPAPAPLSPLVDDMERRRDSAYMTRFNRRKLEEMIRSTHEAKDDIEICKMLHAYFIDTERMANGSPRRTLAKICRWAHGGFSLKYASALLEQEEKSTACFGACPESRATAAYQMLMEAAGDPPGFPSSPKADEACCVVNKVIETINDLASGLKTAAHPQYPKGIDFCGGRLYFSVLDQWRLDMVLSPTFHNDRETLKLIAECLYRDLPQEYQARDELRMMDGDSRTVNTEAVIKAAGIALNCDQKEDNPYFENALRRGTFHLLLCCGSSRARRMLNTTVRDALYCLGWSEWEGNFPQDTASELISRIQEMPIKEKENEADFCSGKLKKEVKNFFSQTAADKQEELFSRFSSLSPSEGRRWLSDYLDAKCNQALTVLSYESEQKQQFEIQWQLLDSEEKEYYLSNVLRKQYLTERDIQDPLSFTFSIVQTAKKSERMRLKETSHDTKTKQARCYIDLGKRNSEPSRNLILLMALVHFGAVAEKDARSLTLPCCEKYISDCIKKAWSVGWHLSQTDDELDQTVETIIQSALNQFIALNSRKTSETLFSLWRSSLQIACEQYRSKCRDQEIKYLMRFNQFGKKSRHLLVCRNALFSAALMAGQWKYDREKK